MSCCQSDILKNKVSKGQTEKQNKFHLTLAVANSK